MNIQPIKSNQNFGAISVTGPVKELETVAQEAIAAVLENPRIKKLGEKNNINLQAGAQSLVVDVLNLKRKDGMRSVKILPEITVKTIKDAIQALAKHNRARIKS